MELEFIIFELYKFLGQNLENFCTSSKHEATQFLIIYELRKFTDDWIQWSSLGLCPL